MDAVITLKEASFDMKQLSIIGQDYHTEDRPLGFVNSGDRMISWGKYGAFWGSVWGLLFGSAMLFVPGVGQLLLAGYIVGALEGAFIGGSFGVIGGALASYGIPENTVIAYESALKADSFLLMIQGTTSEQERAHEILSKGPAIRFDTFTEKAKEPAGVA